MILKKGLKIFNVCLESTCFSNDIENYIISFPDYGYNSKNKTINVTISDIKSKDNINLNYFNVVESDELNLSPCVKREYYINTDEKIDILDIDSINLFIIRDYNKWNIRIYTDGINGQLLIENVIDTFIANYIYSIHMLPCHGATIIKDNVGMSLLGKSGSGKSTSVSCLIQQINGFLSNDFFFIDINKNMAYSLDRTIAVRDNEFVAVKKLQTKLKKESVVVYKKEQVYYDAMLFFGNKFKLESPINIIMFCEITNISKEEVIRLNKLETISYFIKNAIIPSKLIMDTKEFLEIIIELYNRIPIYKLLIPNLESYDNNKPLFTSSFIKEMVSNI